ncbi:unnamed protein product [Amoebophrya sp. A25]|nr:unnamed protein product [Amoebophrya sp. A25]|eukprot:GSA25T00009758001.1
MKTSVPPTANGTGGGLGSGLGSSSSLLSVPFGVRAPNSSPEIADTSLSETPIDPSQDSLPRISAANASPPRQPLIGGTGGRGVLRGTQLHGSPLQAAELEARLLRSISEDASRSREVDEKYEQEDQPQIRIPSYEQRLEDQMRDLEANQARELAQARRSQQTLWDMQRDLLGGMHQQHLSSLGAPISPEQQQEPKSWFEEVDPNMSLRKYVRQPSEQQVVESPNASVRHLVHHYENISASVHPGGVGSPRSIQANTNSPGGGSTWSGSTAASFRTSPGRTRTNEDLLYNTSSIATTARFGPPLNAERVSIDDWHPVRRPTPEPTSSPRVEQYNEEEEQSGYPKVPSSQPTTSSAPSSSDRGEQMDKPQISEMQPQYCELGQYGPAARSGSQSAGGTQYPKAGVIGSGSAWTSAETTSPAMRAEGTVYDNFIVGGGEQYRQIRPPSSAVVEELGPVRHDAFGSSAGQKNQGKPVKVSFQHNIPNTSEDAVRSTGVLSVTTGYASLGKIQLSDAGRNSQVVEMNGIAAKPERVSEADTSWDPAELQARRLANKGNDKTRRDCCFCG